MINMLHLESVKSPRYMQRYTQLATQMNEEILSDDIKFSFKHATWELVLFTYALKNRDLQSALLHITQVQRILESISIREPLFCNLHVFSRRLLSQYQHYCNRKMPAASAGIRY